MIGFAMLCCALLMLMLYYALLSFPKLMLDSRYALLCHAMRCHVRYAKKRHVHACRASIPIQCYAARLLKGKKL